MGSACGNEALGLADWLLAGWPGAVTFPEPSRGSLAPAAGGMSWLPQGPRRVIYAVLPAPFTVPLTTAPGGGQGTGAGKHVRGVTHSPGIIDSCPLPGSPHVGP